MVLQEYEPASFTYEVVNTYPHRTTDFTQGLLFKDGYIFESTGQKGESAFLKKELSTGKVIQAVNLSNEYFGEGLALLNNQFFQLTWTAGKAFVYNEKMELINTLNYSTEGWGLAAMDNQLIMSIGTEEILFVEPTSFATLRSLEVYDNEDKVDSLNELEVIDNTLYANIWQSNTIIAVDLESGEVLSTIDLSGLLSAEESEDAGVLNGIAYDSENDRIFVTGKDWPKLFEVKFIPKNIQ
jgi:glutamine cyclotransferase